VALATSIGILLNAAATLYARATAPRNPPAIAIAAPHTAPPETLDDLVAAYPDFLARHDGRFLYWRDGSRTAIGEESNRTPDAIVHNPQIRDIFAWPYPLGAMPASPLGDPGRARPAALFTRMYGNCAKGEVEGRLAEINWVGGRKLRFTRINGAAAALEATARDLEKLGPAYAKYLWPTSGTYNCRPIAGTNSASMHGYGAAIDLASRFGAYWRWSARPAADRAIPMEIVAVFERHGFIWGGKWAHFDSFHFEYRPELIRAARRGASGAE
jgi:hypothetical protein